MVTEKGRVDGYHYYTKYTAGTRDNFYIFTFFFFSFGGIEDCHPTVPVNTINSL